MTVFRNEPSDWSRLDWRLLLNGFVHHYPLRAELDEDVDWLERHGYTILRADGSTWVSVADLHDGLAKAWRFPGYYGHNLDALADALDDVAYLNDHARTGTALVITGLLAFADDHPTVIRLVNEIIEDACRHGLLIGHRMVALLEAPGR